MPDNAVAGLGTQFRRWSGSQWVLVSDIISITGPGMTRTTFDTTTLNTAGGYRTFKTGLRDAGQITLNMVFTRTSLDLMKTDFESNDPVNYEIVLPDADNTTFEFAGLVTELPLTIAIDDKITMDVTIQISGQVSVNSGSGSG